MSWIKASERHPPNWFEATLRHIETKEVCGPSPVKSVHKTLVEFDTKGYESATYISNIEWWEESPVSDAVELPETLSDALLLEIFKSVSLFDLSDCKFEFGNDASTQWINAELKGRVIDCIVYDGNIIKMMNYDGSFSPLNPQYKWLYKISKSASSTAPSTQTTNEQTTNENEQKENKKS